MPRLRVVLIDVGWGDSILLEAEDSNGGISRGLIDSNDTTYSQNTFLFVKRYLETNRVEWGEGKAPVFDFVMLSHWHKDHSSGLQRIIREFRTRNFWFPKTVEKKLEGGLFRYAKRYTHLAERCESLDRIKFPPNFGPAAIKVLWPRNEDECPGGGSVDTKNENNNSIVFALRLGSVSFLFCGDTEAEVWEHIRDDIPHNTRFFKVPHHGSVNGFFGAGDQPAWLNHCPPEAHLGISGHVVPHTHPDVEVVDALNRARRTYYRTDHHYHIIAETTGRKVTVRYTH